MKAKLFIVLLLALFLIPVAKGQIDSVIVEKYYISDSKDATDNYGGTLATGSVTYRIFVDLTPGSKLMKIYGNAVHPFIISSTADIFNNQDRGESLAKELKVALLKKNTVALDSWLTLGLATSTNFGIPKEEDSNGSAVGGVNNDGGSAHVAGGLLVNNDLAAGIPVTTADGLVPATRLPSNWVAQLNEINIESETDTSVFGILNTGKQFISNNFNLGNSGVSGTTSKNRVLIAQVTTKGTISFKINVVVEETGGSGTSLVKYVAENPAPNEKTNRFLSYPLPPPPCGCKNPDYLEFNKNLLCHKQDSCKTLIVYGCMDPRACNFDPKANYNILSICCYPGKCNNRDINVVCPSIKGNTLDLALYPNPAYENLTLEVTNPNQSDIQCVVYNSNGAPQFTEKIGEQTDSFNHQLNISSLQKGIYFISLFSDGKTLTRSFIKK